MRKLLTLAIPMLIGVGLLTAAVHQDPSGEHGRKSQAGGVAASSSQPAVIEEAAAPTTTTTAAPETTTTTLAPPLVTTTTLAPVTTTTAKRTITPVTAPRPRPTPTTTAPPAQTQAAAEPQMIDCGTGEASTSGSFKGSDTVGGVVVNQTTKPIELDRLVVTVTFRSGLKKQYSFNVAGRQVETSQAGPNANRAEFSMPMDAPAGDSPTSVVVSDFQFHTAGLPECTSH